MAKIIDKSETQNHSIKKFSFMQFADREVESYSPIDFNSDDTDVKNRDENFDKNQPTSEGVDELLKKIESLTEENVALELKVENFEKELEEKLAQTEEEAYNRGRDEALKEIQEELNSEIEELKSQLIKSITKLDELSFEFQNSLKKVEDELIDASVTIAKKVVIKEIDKNSSDVAKTLSANFISKIKDASYILIKTNPQDFQYIKESLSKLENVKIESDDAISKGGIVILSDVKNIDATIETRLKKAIALIKKEG
jgi:flagellar assembly protein FliH